MNFSSVVLFMALEIFEFPSVKLYLWFKYFLGDIGNDSQVTVELVAARAGKAQTEHSQWPPQLLNSTSGTQVVSSSHVTPSKQDFVFHDIPNNWFQ